MTNQIAKKKNGPIKKYIYLIVKPLKNRKCHEIACRYLRFVLFLSIQHVLAHNIFLPQFIDLLIFLISFENILWHFEIRITACEAEITDLVEIIGKIECFRYYDILFFE